MAALSEQRIIVSLHSNNSGVSDTKVVEMKFPQNGKTSNDKIEMEIPRIERESSMSLIMPTLNGDKSCHPLSSSENGLSPPPPHCNEAVTIDLDEKKDVFIKQSNDIKYKTKTNIFWRPICPFSLSGKFEKIDNKIRGYMYSFILTPDAYHTKFAVLTPKTISNTLELPYIKFKIHYPHYMPSSPSSPMSCNVAFGHTTIPPLHDFNHNEWQWLTEFNKIIFEILYPNLSNWHYAMQENQDIQWQSFELRNYLIAPLNKTHNIDWNLMQEIVKYFYCKHNEYYNTKQLLADLGLVDVEKKEEHLSDIVLFENGKYFIPFNESKQRIIAYIKQIIEQYKEEKEELQDLNEMDELLEEIDDIYTQTAHDEKENDDEDDNDMDGIIDKIENKVRVQLLSLCFDKMEYFVGNVTDSMSLVYNSCKQANKWIIEPRIDFIDINRNGIYKAPFNVDFFYSLLRIPFILFQFERIFAILQFIQSQQYINKTLTLKPNNYKTYMHLDSFLIKIPSLILSKIMYQERISVPYNGLFEHVGQELLRTIYCTSSTLLLLDTKDTNMISMTSNLMNNSLKIFRKTLESNQIMHYFAPSQFRKSYWRPSRFYNISINDIDTQTLPNNYYKFIAQSVIGRNINEYIATLLYPLRNNEKSMQISDKYLFSIQNNLFSSIWYYNYAKKNDLKYGKNKLFFDCNNIINWMQMDKILNLSLKNIQNITKALDAATKILNISTDYSFFEFYRQSTNYLSMTPTLSRRRSLLKTLSVNKEKDEKKEEKENKLLGLQWSNTEFEQLNSETQSLICRFIRNVEYEFEYPPILIAIIDPFFILRNEENKHDIYQKLTFELLYDLGNIVLNVVISLSVATSCYQSKSPNKVKHRHPYEKLQGMKKVLFYKKCLTSNKYLSDKCKLHRLYKHIIAKNNEFSSELLAAFMLSIIGAIYLDSNLNKLEQEAIIDTTKTNNNGIQLENVWNFVERFLPEVVLEDDIQNVVHSLRRKNRNQHKANNRNHNYHPTQRQHNNIKNSYNLQPLPTNCIRSTQILPNQKRLKTPRVGMRNGFKLHTNGYIKRGNTMPNIHTNKNANMMTLSNYRRRRK